MTLPKIKKFTDYNHYPDEAQPTTDTDMQDYMQNQNDILNALTKRLWQPQTEYKLGDIVASDAMADGLVAVCTIAGVTSDIEPEWGANEATVIDNYCTWEMRLAYSYALATNDDVQNAHDDQSAEATHLLNIGNVSKIFELVKSKFTALFGTDNVLPKEYGGTGVSADSANALLKALIGSGSIGSSSQPIYYKDGKFYAGGYTFRLNHNTTDDKIPVFANGMLDYILKSELANATTGGGIVAALLEQNGYVKFSNGLILQWGTYSNNAANFPISFSAVYQAVAVPTTSTTVYSNPAPHVPICTSLNNNSVKFSSYYLTQQQANQWEAVNASGRYIAVGKA